MVSEQQNEKSSTHTNRNKIPSRTGRWGQGKNKEIPIYDPEQIQTVKEYVKKYGDMPLEVEKAFGEGTNFRSVLFMKLFIAGIFTREDVHGVFGRKYTGQ